MSNIETIDKSAFRKEHVSIKDRLIEKVVELLTEHDPELKSYHISESWDKRAQETVQLTIGTVRLDISMTEGL